MVREFTVEIGQSLIGPQITENVSDGRFATRNRTVYTLIR